MKRVRVAHVITRLCRGGAQENTFHTVRLANRARFDVDLISGPTSGAEGSIEETVQAAGIPILREPYLRRDVSPVRDSLTLLRLARRFRAGGYDIVHTHTSKAGMLGRQAAYLAGTPIVVHTPHGNVFHDYFHPLVTNVFIWMERQAARHTDRIIELTPGGVEAHLKERIGRREQYAVIPSGIDFAPFEAARARRSATRAALGIAEEDVLIGAVGRLEPIKGFTYFLEAAQTVAASCPRARFALAGQGSLEMQLRDQARPLGGRIAFLGPRDDVPDLMAAFDVLTAPSLNEGMGRVVIEAAAAGTPCVASRAGGLPDVVEDGVSGLLAPPGDAAALAAALLALANDAERRAGMGAAARQKAVPAFGLEVMVQRIEALYEELLDAKSRHPRR